MTQASALHLLTSGAVSGQWALDPVNTKVAIAHKTMWGLVTVKGGFATVSGEAVVSADGQVTGTVNIDSASVDTKNRKRDEHLRSADLFDAATYPQITVEILSATVVDDELRAQTEVTVKGVRQPMPLTAQISAATASSVTLLVGVEVDRDRFGVSWNKLGMIKGLTTVTITATFTHSA